MLRMFRRVQERRCLQMKSVANVELPCLVNTRRVLDGGAALPSPGARVISFLASTHHYPVHTHLIPSRITTIMPALDEFQARDFTQFYPRDFRSQVTPTPTQRTTLIVAGVYIIAIAILWCVEYSSSFHR